MSQGWQRRFATGTNAILASALVVAGVAFAVDLAGQFRYRVDLSEEGLATLDADTVAVLEQVEASGREVEIIAFSERADRPRAREKNRTMRDFLRELEVQSPALRTEFVDLDSERVYAEKLEVTSYGTVVVRRGDQRVDIKGREVFRFQGGGEDGSPTFEFRGEALIARGISQVLSGEPRTLYVLEGHGELALSRQGPDGLAQLVTSLERQGWDVETLDLLRDRDPGAEAEVPRDADAVFLLAPTASLAAAEEAALVDFLGRGGGLGVFLEPSGSVPDFLEELGIRRPTGEVRDLRYFGNRQEQPILGYGQHPIVEELSVNRIAVVLSGIAPLALTPVPGVTHTELLVTTPGAWIERGTERVSAFDPEVDEMGRQSAMVAVEVTDALPFVGEGLTGRVVAVGDVDWLTDEFQQTLGNPSLAVNVGRWLVQDDRDSLVGRPGRVRQLTMGREELTRVGWLVMGLWPLLAVVAGGVVWWLRRSR